MTAETIAKALGGRKAGNSWMVHCPAHIGGTPSLSLRDTDDSKVLVCCHAGCAQGEVILNLRSSGLWTQNGSSLFRHIAPRSMTKRTEPDRDDGIFSIVQ